MTAQQQPIGRRSLREKILMRLAALPLPWWRKAGTLLGLLLYALAIPRRRVVAANLAYCFPEKSVAWRRAVTKRVFVRFGQSWLDRIWLWHGDEDLLRQRLIIERPESPWDTAQILFVPHSMGVDASWTALTLLQEQPLVALYSNSSSAWQDRWMEKGRRRFAPDGALPRVGSAKAVVRSLRSGVSVHLSPDMDLGAKDAVVVPFMGRPAATVTSLPRFSALGRVAVRPAFTTMTATGYCTQVGEPWWGYPSGDDVADVARMNNCLDEWVREHADEYYWVHRRFKTRIGDMPDIYSGNQ